MNEKQPQRLRDTELEDLKPITHRIIGAAIEVHEVLGIGLPESVYERALCIEFDLRGLKYARQMSVAAVYKGLLGQYRVDLVVEDKVVVEVKSVSVVSPVFEGQVLTYLRLTGKRVGLLLNFHARRMVDGVHRYVL